MDTPETKCPITAPAEEDQAEKSCEVKMSSQKAAHSKSCVHPIIRQKQLSH